MGHQKLTKKFTEAMPNQSHKRLHRSDAGLHHAATRGDIDTLRALLDAECDTNHIDVLDWAGRAPLMYAAQGGHTDCVRLLLQRGADVNNRSRDRGTAAHYAAEHGHKEALLVLLDGGCDVDATDDLDMTPLMCAAQDGQTECVQLLLERDADVSQSDLGELTAVHHTAWRDDVETMRVLLASAADTVALDPLFHFSFPASVPQGAVSFALACGCRVEAPCCAIEATGASVLRPIICGYFSLSHLL